MMKYLLKAAIILALLVSANVTKAQPKITGVYYGDSCWFGSSVPYAISYFVYASSSGSGLTMYTYFGDGTGTFATVSGTTCYGSHTYTSPGIYTIKHILYNSGVPIDSITKIDTVDCRQIWIEFYHDANSNCVRDVGEYGYYYPQQVEVDSNGVPVDTIAAYSYVSYKPKGIGTYVFKPLSMPTGTTLACPSSGQISVTVNTSFLATLISFGYQCANTNFDLSLALNANYRPTSWSRVQVWAYNNACSAKNGVVTVVLSSKYAYSSATPTPSSVSGNVITWNVNNLSATHHEYIHMQVTPTTSVNLGDTICTSATITPTSGDVYTTNNFASRCDSVRSSFDPNSKEVEPRGYIQPGTTLTYTLNFENMGNDTAFNIHLLDTLSDKLDVNTMKLLSASHSVVPNLIEGPAGVKILRFDFPNINLEDKNYPERNKGYVKFSIKTKPGLASSTQITNQAGIYFDVNPVVMTNAVVSIIEPNSVGKVNKDAAVSIYPNPASDMLTVKAIGYQSVKLINTIGQTVAEQTIEQGEAIVNVKQLVSGIYYVIVKGESGIIAQKIEKL